MDSAEMLRIGLLEGTGRRKRGGIEKMLCFSLT
jgi:hypothetical protein